MSLQETKKTSGWEYIERLMDDEVMRTTNELLSKKFGDLSEVHRLQDRLRFIRDFRADIDNQIQRGIEALEKEQEKGVGK